MNKVAKSFNDYDKIVLKAVEKEKQNITTGFIHTEKAYNDYYHYMVDNNVATIYVICEHGWYYTSRYSKMFKDKKSACSFIGLTEKEYEEYSRLTKETHFYWEGYYYHEIKEIILKEVVEEKIKYEREKVKAEITSEIRNEIEKNEKEDIIKDQKHKDWLIIREKLKNFEEDLKEAIYRDE